jgi:SAM-dependent methyltransferase
MMLPPNFNWLARLYRWMELFSFGPWLMLCRCAFLNECLNSCRALALGDGDGRFTARLLRENPAIRIDAVDASPAMLSALSRRAGPHNARLRTHQADVRSLQLANPAYDLIITHFFLDCLDSEEVQALAACLGGVASPGSLWIVSEFAIPSDWFGMLVARPIVWALYRVFGWLTGLQVRSLPDHHLALRQAGFTLEKHRCWLKGLLISEVWSAADRSQSSSAGQSRGG